MQVPGARGRVRERARERERERERERARESERARECAGERDRERQSARGGEGHGYRLGPPDPAALSQFTMVVSMAVMMYMRRQVCCPVLHAARIALITVMRC
jgi:hypothetical protein